MKKAVFWVMVVTVLSKILGFVREMVQSYFFGASAITDAYLISQTVPHQLFVFISAGIATSFIPLYSRILKEEGKLSADRYTNNISNVLLLLASVVVIAVMVFTEPLVRLFAVGFTGETLRLAVNFTRIGVFGVYFSAIMGIFSEYLRIHNNFIVPALVGFPLNFVIIVSLYISGHTSVYVLAVGTVIAAASQLLFFVPFLRTKGFKFQAVVDVKDKYLKMMILMALPVIIGRSVNRINVLVDRTLASAIAIGGISALNYASRIKGFVQNIFVDSISTVFYPMISGMAADSNIKGLKTAISETINIISLLVIPATVGAMLFSREIVVLLFGRGAFTLEAIEVTSIALFYYSAGMLPIGLRSILARSFYAYRDTKTPMINATIGVVINIILNIILSKYMGIGGLALATSISAIVTAVLMFVTLRKKIGPFGLLEISRSFIKIILASATMGLFAFGSFKFFLFHFTQNLALIGAIIIGALVYGLIIYFMKIPEVDNTLAVLKKKIAGGINRVKNNKED